MLGGGIPEPALWDTQSLSLGHFNSDRRIRNWWQKCQAEGDPTPVRLAISSQAP